MISKTRVVFLGTRVLGSYALDLLKSLEHVNVAAVVSRPLHEEKHPYWISGPFESAQIARIPVVSSIEEIDFDFDFGLSVNYWKKIPNDFLTRAKLGIVNLHHSFNLEVKGRMCTTKAIQNCKDGITNFTGSTLHYINQEFDAGPIIQSLPCIIEDHETAYEVFQKNEILGKELLDFWLPILTKTKVQVSIPQKVDSKKFLDNHDLTSKMDYFRLNKFEFYNIVRSFEFNNFFEPAFYLSFSGQKKYLTIRREKGITTVSTVDAMRAVYEF
jgi:methionyl-tRNA formyltransferase